MHFLPGLGRAALTHEIGSTGHCLGRLHHCTIRLGFAATLPADG
jgi:hypothetical protein